MTECVFAGVEEKHAVRYTPYRGLATVTAWVKLKFVEMNLKKARGCICCVFLNDSGRNAVFPIVRSHTAVAAVWFLLIDVELLLAGT